MQVLLIEDDDKVADVILSGLTEEGFTVSRANNGILGFEMARKNYYDTLIVDINLPGRNGLDLIEQLRGEKVSTPILVLSANHTVDDRVTGLRKGGDDYLTKPFAFAELLARVQALHRRSSSHDRPTQLQVGDLTLDLLTREASREGQPLDLQPREFELLEYLMRNAGMVVLRTMLIENVWNYNFDPTTNIVESRVSRLREKLDKPFEKKMLHTVRGAGYILKEP